MTAHASRCIGLSISSAIVIFVSAMLITPSLAGPAPGADFFQIGIERYQRDDFEASIQAFREALEAAPHVAKYHRWLGKAYGRLAERSNWVQALALARKTKEAFEKAVELDPQDAEALSDLMSYYEEAPRFLGGDKRKAKAIRQRLSTIVRDTGG